MARKKDQNKTTFKVILEGENQDAYQLFENSMRSKRKYQSHNHTLNKIIEHWIKNTPAVLRGYDIP